MTQWGQSGGEGFSAAAPAADCQTSWTITPESHHLHVRVCACVCVRPETGGAEGWFPAGLGLAAGAVGQQPFARQLRAVHPPALL